MALNGRNEVELNRRNKLVFHGRHMQKCKNIRQVVDVKYSHRGLFKNSHRPCKESHVKTSKEIVFAMDEALVMQEKSSIKEMKVSDSNGKANRSPSPSCVMEVKAHWKYLVRTGNKHALKDNEAGIERMHEEKVGLPPNH